MADDKRVRFIRKNGRVIPIRSKRDRTGEKARKSAYAGGALVGLGIANNAARTSRGLAPGKIGKAMAFGGTVLGLGSMGLRIEQGSQKRKKGDKSALGGFLFDEAIAKPAAAIAATGLSLVGGRQLGKLSRKIRRTRKSGKTIRKINAPGVIDI